MKAVKLRPFIPSGENYELAQQFFEDLGFKKLYADSGITIFRMDELEFYLQNLHNRELQDNYMVELVVADLDGWWAHLQQVAKNGKYPVTCKEPTLYPWGKREVHLIDPAGVCWHISEATRQ